VTWVANTFRSQSQNKMQEVWCFIYRKLRPNQSKDQYKKIEMKKINMSGKGIEKDEQEALNGKVDEKEEEKTRAMWDCGSPLYDSYELVSLDHHINRNLMAFPSLHGSKRIITRCMHDSHDMVHIEKVKESFWVTSFRTFLVKMMRRKDNSEEKLKKNKEMRRGMARSIVDFLSCEGNKKLHE